MNIGILCPTRQRVGWTKRMVNSCLDTASDPDHIKIVLRLDMDNFEDHEGYKKLIRVGIDKVLIGPSKCLSLLWNDLYKLLGESTQLNMHSADDLIFRTQGWDAVAREEAKKFPKGIGMVYFDDAIQHEGLSTHGFYSRGWSEALGFFMPPYYTANFNDTHNMWLGKNLQQRGHSNCCIYRGDILLEHMHPSNPNGNTSWSEPVYKLQLMRMQRDKCDQLYLSKQNERESDLNKLLNVIKGETK